MPKSTKSKSKLDQPAVKPVPAKKTVKKAVETAKKQRARTASVNAEKARAAATAAHVGAETKARKNLLADSAKQGLKNARSSDGRLKNSKPKATVQRALTSSAPAPKRNKKAQKQADTVTQEHPAPTVETRLPESSPPAEAKAKRKSTHKRKTSEIDTHSPVNMDEAVTGAVIEAQFEVTQCVVTATEIIAASSQLPESSTSQLEAEAPAEKVKKTSKIKKSRKQDLDLRQAQLATDEIVVSAQTEPEAVATEPVVENTGILDKAEIPAIFDAPDTTVVSDETCTGVAHSSESGRVKRGRKKDSDEAAVTVAQTQDDEDESDLQDLPESPEELLKMRRTIEALLFAAEAPMQARELARAANIKTKRMRTLLEELKTDYDRQQLAWELVEIAEGYRFVTRKEHFPAINKLKSNRSQRRLTPAALETLALIAYSETPLDRAEIENIRGVDSSQVIRMLLERRLIKVGARGEGLGQPLQYVVTEEFLEYFGLQSTEQLPRPGELKTEKE